VNNLIEPNGQQESDELSDPRVLFAAAERMRPAPLPPGAPRKSVLCLSGGGAYGAFTAGVMCGWTQAGDRPGTNGRPNFDVVTGISTGALIAPLVFLGPEYDDTVKRFYTTVEGRDIYRLRPVRGLFSLALADNAPLARLVADTVTPELIAEIGCEHQKGRRLYVGTTELESHRFVYWDIGEIACRNAPGDRELIHQILLGSSAIPGFFPPARIPVTVDGQRYHELHGDGGVSQAIFYRPPYLPPEQRTDTARDLNGTDLYLVLAGKLYADAEPVKARSLTLAGSSVSAVLYAQARGDLARLYLISTIAGMNYHLCSMPADFPAPTSAASFERKAMTAMFDEGYRIASTGRAWRGSPPGVEAGESVLKRGGTVLTHQVRGPGLVVPKKGPPINPLLAAGRMPVPVTPDVLVK
jgi:predicted acylesterase/phospholipase RssA